MSSSYPLTPAELKLRMDLGTDGDTGNEAHAKLDRLKADTNNILTDTADMQPRLIDVESDIAALQGDVTAGFGDVSTILSEVQNAMYGLSAIHDDLAVVDGVADSILAELGSNVNGSVALDIAAVQTAVDANQVDLNAIIAELGDNVNGSVALDIAAVQTAVDNIQNNTRTTVALTQELEKPASNQAYYKIVLANYDSAGNMEAPDAPGVTVTVEAADGTDRSGNLYEDEGSTALTNDLMVNDSTGVYSAYYQVDATDPANEQLIFEFTVTENAVARKIYRTARVVEEVSSTFTAADRTKLGDIYDDTDELQQDWANGGRLDTILDTIAADVVTVDGVVDAIKVDTTDILQDLDDVKVKDTGSAGYDADEMSLEALAEKIDSLQNESSSLQMVRATGNTGTAFGTGQTRTVNLTLPTGITAVNVKELRVVPTTQTCTNFTVEVGEDSSFNNILLKYERGRPSRGDLKLAIDLLFLNQDGPPANNIVYVRVTNVADTSTSVFNVELRGLELVAP